MEDEFEQILEGKGLSDNPGELENNPSEEAPPVVEEKLIGGKFRSVDDLLEAYENIEREKGRLGNEVGQLRGLLSSSPPTQAPAPQMHSLEWFDDLAENNPKAAVEWALNNNPDLYGRAMQYWIDEEPLVAMDYHTDIKLAIERQKMLNYVNPQIQPMQEDRQVEQIAGTMHGMLASNPDLANHFDDMLKIADERPYLLMNLVEGDPAQQQMAIQDLYDLAVRRSTGSTAPFVEGGSSTQVPANTGEKSNVDIFKEFILSDPLNDPDYR